MSDPRELGFNYGRGWGAAPKPPVYLQAAKLARQLGQQVSQMSAQAWALEMALRSVQLATTGVEKAVAIAELERKLQGLKTLVE